MEFTVNKEVFQQLPGVCFGVVIARGLDNSQEIPVIDQLLGEAVSSARQKLQGVSIKEYEAIIPYREAFQRLGFNPNKFQSSIEAMLSRIAKGSDLPKINSVVNLVNAVSLKYEVPMGAHDIEGLPAGMDVRFSRPQDTFIPFGQNQAETVEPDELVYASGSAIKTRRWIWRQSELGKITRESRHIFFPIDGFRDRNYPAVLVAQDELASLLEEIFHCQVIKGMVEADCPRIEF